MSHVGILLQEVWGNEARYGTPLGTVIKRIRDASRFLPEPVDVDDPSVDVYLYFSGKHWRHERSGFKLGTLSSRGRSWLRVMIYVPDDLSEEAASVAYFRETFEAVAESVAARLRKRRPDWPIDEITRQIRALKPS
jgi:hypothetical protein